MDVERTIEFILQCQAKAELRTEKTEARATAHEARMAAHEARMAAHEARTAAMEKRLDKRMDAITKLLQQGMRLLITTRTEFAALRKRTDMKLAELAEAQKETDRSLKALIKSLSNGRNGH